MYRDTEQRIDDRELMELLGIALTLVPDHGPGTFMPEFPVVPQCLQYGVLTNLGCRLVGIRPGAQIAGHCDAGPRARYHIPLQTNESCWSFSDGVWQQLKVGRLYMMNPTEFHGAVNWGDTVRLHLMVDVGC